MQTVSGWVSSHAGCMGDGGAVIESNVRCDAMRVMDTVVWRCGRRLDCIPQDWGRILLLAAP